MHLQRGQILLQQSRYQEAEKELQQAIGHNPNNPIAYALLSQCLLEMKRYSEALELSTKALHLSPGSSFLFYIHARSLFFNKKTKDARWAIQEGLRLSPNDSDFFGLLANIEFYEENWEAALNASQQGLALDPEDVHLINIRAQALIKLNRQKEAESTIDYALHRAPESSFSHANKGWVAIEQDRFDDAIQSFKEALRLNPESTFAKSGLKEAIKGKNLLYRAILKYFLWMQKLTERARWIFIIGMYILYRIILEMADQFPDLAPFFYTLVALYIVFVFSSWIAIPVSNLFLRLHPLGKHALSNDEKQGSNLVGTLLLFAILSGVLFLGTQSEQSLFLTIYFTIMLIPVGGLFSVAAEGKARKYLTYYTIALAICGAIFILSAEIILAILFLFGIFAYGWVANYFISKDSKEFY